MGAVSGGVGVAEVFDLVAGWTEGDHPLEALHELPLVVVPALVAFDGVLWPAPAAHFAAIAGCAVRGFADHVPVSLADFAADVGVPAGRGHELDREPRGRRAVAINANAGRLVLEGAD